jgi:aspartate aminotransferase
VTNGGTGALYSSLASLLSIGDEVLLPDPGWPNYIGMITLLGARPVRYPLAGGLPDPEAIERLVGERTRVLLLNSPSNPVGAVVSDELMTALTGLAERHGLWVVSDEVYEDMAFDGVPASAAAADGNVVTVHSFSKSYAMTGWRVGYAVAPRDAAAIIAKVQEPLISCVNAPAQMAALAALTGPQDCVARMREAYRERRDQVLEIFDGTPVKARVPAGAFYVWADVSASGRTGAEFARTLITERRTAVVPGAAFGPSGESSIRLSLATSAEILLEGARRIVEHCTA